MDTLSDLLRRAGATDARVRQLIQRPPWSMTYADPPALTVFATFGGPAMLRLEDVPAVPPTRLAAGDIALVAHSARHTISDDLATPPQVLIRGGRKQLLGGSRAQAVMEGRLAPRTWGDGLPGATRVLRGMFQLRGEAGRRLLAMLPPLAVIPAGPRTGAALDLLAGEAARDEPGQDAVLNRSLDLVLVLALRSWCASIGPADPSWYAALTDPSIGTALDQLHTDPARPWTVAELAEVAGMSRAAFAARFARLVGQPPMAYLTDWRMTLAADLLREEAATTVAAAARAVGYQDAFAFSVAFKRAKGVSPSRWGREEDPVAAEAAVR
ncbi:AraC family transcriptional regulator [Catenulispora sp. NL8]|uniref:AraC family transcriptional regulator n=1 Tax=Catenulispora pinistramenti TaxID=2705254 RepID=A0ABS5KM16_9ACTN|nr:AraC family transcriptional regulator [Catenulispora pinistramenti]MBS2547071.1 AraC family transcriptional regulator [Catenulispora pinistramenti]